MLPMGATIAHEWSPPKSWVSLGYYRASFPSWLPCTLIALILAWFLHLHVLLVAGILDIFPFQRNMEIVWRYCWLRGSFSVGCQWRYQYSLLHSANRKRAKHCPPFGYFQEEETKSRRVESKLTIKMMKFRSEFDSTNSTTISKDLETQTRYYIRGRGLVDRISTLIPCSWAQCWAVLISSEFIGTEDIQKPYNDDIGLCRSWGVIIGWPDY